MVGAGKMLGQCLRSNVAGTLICIHAGAEAPLVSKNFDPQPAQITGADLADSTVTQDQGALSG